MNVSVLRHFVYIIKSEVGGIFYKGYSTDVLTRLDDHNAGKSRYTSKKRPWKLVYVEELPSKREALIKEKKLKRANTTYLNWLIDQPSNIVAEFIG